MSSWPNTPQCIYIYTNVYKNSSTGHTLDSTLLPCAAVKFVDCFNEATASLLSIH